jgi:hypothetical protein
MLAGERTREYLTRDREPRAVCDLCRTRVQRAGWVRADLSEAPAEVPEAPAEEKARPPESAQATSSPSPSGRRQRRDQGEEAAARSSRGTAPGRPGPTETPERRIRRALDRFNESEHRRTVAGLTRSLGRPRVAAITPAETPDQVRLTVAWNLSWYQWKVDFSGEAAAVRSLRNGKEVSELGAADQAWNASATEDGRLQLGLSSNGDREARAPDT